MALKSLPSLGGSCGEVIDNFPGSLHLDIVSFEQYVLQSNPLGMPPKDESSP